MLPLLDTVIGFVAIRPVLSMLVKSVTSLVTNHVDFYSTNLEHEFDRLVLAVLGKTSNQTVADLEKNPATLKEAVWFKGINWERRGDEFLTTEHMKWVLKKLGAPDVTLKNLEDRLRVHIA
jgi:hypothetical protein